MKIEISENERNSIGALIFALNNSSWLNDKGLPMVGKEAIKLNSQLSVALSLYNRLVDADKGGTKTGKPAKTKKTKKAPKEEVSKDGI